MSYVSLLLLEAVRSPDANGAMDQQLLSTVGDPNSEMVLMTIIDWQQKNTDGVDYENISRNTAELYRMTLNLQKHR